MESMGNHVYYPARASSLAAAKAVTHKTGRRNHQLARSLTMHIHVGPAAIDFSLGRPLQQPVDSGHAWGILHLVLGMVLSQSLPKLLRRRGAVLGRVAMDTSPTDPELMAWALRVVFS